MLDHVISADQFDRTTLEYIFQHADLMARLMRRANRADRNTLLAGRSMASLFWEPSTRTKASFEFAIQHLGGFVGYSTENAGAFSSFAKGAILEDEIRVISGGYYPDVIVMRAPEIGFAARAAAVSKVPIINAGDGMGEHPTQALLDAYTIQKELDGIDGLKIAFVGDLKYGRTVHSLVKLLARNYRNIEMYFVAPDVLQIPWELEYEVESHGATVIKAETLLDVAELADVVYMTRTQYERIEDEDERSRERLQRANFVINDDVLKAMQVDARIMHPLPRNDEIPTYINEKTEPVRAAFFRQSDNGLPVRMALLRLLLNPN